MDSFRWISVVLSMILGLGLTRLLSTTVALFRFRRKVTGDWIPFAWAGCVFIQQLQFWWAIMELPSLVGAWTQGLFVLLVSLPLLLFLSAELILPPPGQEDRLDLLASFEHNGKWSLIALSVYFLLAFVTDVMYWGLSPFTFTGGLIMVQIALPLVVVLSHRRRVREVITAIYVPLTIFGASFLSRWTY